ncbi:MAG: hypothetical protein JRJ23_02685 [Deltaproteobacteria bacterium]|nr:hypothetical protein [Deltaproteobacteria bacterium]MBW1913515.1 hypothetical protein [Deltaproteobacteria bacterium]
MDAWCKFIEKSAIKPLKKIAKILMHHSHGLLNYYFQRISCGLKKWILEGK